VGLALDFFEDILDRIYEAAIVPELWPDVLDRIAAPSQSVGGVLFAVSPPAVLLDEIPAKPVTRWISSQALVAPFNAFIDEGFLERNIRTERAFKNNLLGSFFTDAEMLSEEEIQTESLYKLAREYGLGRCAGLIVQAPTGDAIIFDIERSHQSGPISVESIAQLNLLKSHLSRSALMASRVGLNEARAAAETLGILGLPAAVLSPYHRFLAANEFMQRLMPTVVEERAAGQMHLADKSADQLFASALSDALAAQSDIKIAAEQVFSVPIPAKDEQPAMVAHVIPVRRAARDVFSLAASIVVMTPVCPAQVPSATVVQGLFDLTAAEARIASRIAGGETISAIALGTDTSEGTIRSQLKSVFGKIGVSRQADLVGLLGSVGTVRLPGI
jgi:DNA-binding CsgD family transcriptional regulator